MTKKKIEEGIKVKPRSVRGKINLPNSRVEVDTNAVQSRGSQVSISILVRNLKKAAKEELFPPASSING